jgi:lipid II:glycine glycyltransferase (peptidoglycan interpeptide bridge formation enzyme)
MSDIESNNRKERYRELCSKEDGIAIFSQEWWLDSVCGENNWDVFLVEKGGEIVASMPYIVTNKVGFKLAVMPKLTQTLGPYIKYPPGQKYYKRLSWEKKIMTTLIEKLPEVDYFSQNFNRSITNWLPFYWKGFEQTTRYSYVIEGISLGQLQNNLETDIRRRRKKAENLGVSVYESNDVKMFYELNVKTFNRKNIKTPYSYSFIKKLYNSCKKKDAVRMYFAEYKNEVIAANFLVYDKNTVYYLMGGIDPDKGYLGGMDVVQFESIRFAIDSGRVFDFEGSMIESIEKYFRSFGAIQKAYFTITKTNSILLRIRAILLSHLR